MSPEQLERPVDPRSDLWSLGVIAVEWLVGPAAVFRPTRSVSS
jgi:serine/threonine protein kinase